VRSSSPDSHATDRCTSIIGFENVRNWLADVREHADPHVSCILVGNKVDLCEPISGSAGGKDSTSSSPPTASSIKATKSTLGSKAMKGKSREVPYEEAELWAKEEGLLFVEASAKSGVNVEQAFVDASRDILEKIRKGEFDNDRVGRSLQVSSRLELIRHSQSPGVKLSKPNTNLTLEGGGGSKPCC